MAKRLASPYEPGRRTDAWLKIKQKHRLHCAIVGFLARGSAEAHVIAELAIMPIAGALAATMTAVGYHDLRRAKEGVGVDELLRVFA